MARLPQVDRASLATRVLDALVEAIQQGTFPSGRLPPEPELAERMGVSRTTVGRALQALEQIGLIERRPGRGTRLRANASPDLLTIHGLVPFATLLRQRHEVSSKGDWCLHDAPPGGVAERLGRSGPTYEVRRILHADGEPALAMREWIPEDVLAHPLGDREAAFESVLEISADAFAQPINHAIATLLPKVAGPRDLTDLGLAEGTPYLFLDEVFYSAQDWPVAVSEVAIDPRFVHFSLFRRYLG